MLVLELKQGEAVHIGGEGVMVVRVLDVHKSRVHLSVEAPDDQKILRRELLWGEWRDD